MGKVKVWGIWDKKLKDWADAKEFIVMGARKLKDGTHRANWARFSARVLYLPVVLYKLPAQPLPKKKARTK